MTLQQAVRYGLLVEWLVGWLAGFLPELLCYASLMPETGRKTMKALAEVLEKDVVPCQNFDSWKAGWQAEERQTPLLSPGKGTLEQAFYDGCRADRVAWAFSGGYQWAIRSLLPTYIDNSSILALCITESGGGHPKQIQASLTSADESWRVSGRKQFVSGGTGADILFVAVRGGEQPDGLPNIKMVEMLAGASGITLQVMPALPVVPEVPHAAVILDDANVTPDAVLPGDGYTRYIRPFRLCEDLHVQAALLGMVTRKGHELHQPVFVERSLALCHQLVGCQVQDEPSTACLAMEGVEHSVNHLLDDLMPALSDSSEREAWKRDRQLLNIASKARAIRKQKARQWLGLVAE